MDKPDTMRILENIYSTFLRINCDEGAVLVRKYKTMFKKTQKKKGYGNSLGSAINQRLV